MTNGGGSREDNTRPEKGTRWRNPRLRGVWTVASVGPKYVTLVSTIPWVGPSRVDRVMWPGNWEGVGSRG